MAVVNRCAIGVGPKPPLIEWSRQVSGEKAMEWGREEHSLYLIPTYENEKEARTLLEQIYEDIFANELDSWCRDSATWPGPRTFVMFLEWFEIRFYDLVEDVSKGELEHQEVDQEFIEDVRAALGDLKLN